MSVEEFFKLRESDPAHRYAYIDGEIYMMTGGESNNRWTVYILRPGDEVELTSIGESFPVIEIYEKTRFAKQ